MKYDNGGAIIAVSVILEVLVLVCVGLRFYTRIWKKTSFIASDWLLLAATVFATGLTVMQIYGVSIKALAEPLNGSIEDPRAVTGRLNKAKHLELAYLLIGILTLGLIKLSVCFLYWQLFARVVFRRFLIVWIVILIIWTLAFVLSGLLECGSHLKAIFGTPQEYLDHCGSAIPSGWAMVGSDVATDFITLIIPIPVVLSLHLPPLKKALVAATFLVGALSVGASIGKAYIYIAATLGRYTEDAILILTGLSVWNLVEVQVGIIAACGPTLRPILSRMTPTSSIKILLSSFSFYGKRKETSQDTPLPSFVKMTSEEALNPRVDDDQQSDAPSKAQNGRILEMKTYDVNFQTSALGANSRV